MIKPNCLRRIVDYLLFTYTESIRLKPYLLLSLFHNLRLHVHIVWQMAYAYMFINISRLW